MTPWEAGLLLVVLVAAGGAGAASDRRRTRGGGECPGLARYNVTFTALWSRDVFPKQYPLFRPHAQWTKVVGRTHSGGYSIFTVDRLASKALKQFAELGDSDLLDKDSQGMRGVFDAFTLPALDKEAVGVSSGRVVVDGKHSEVSMVAKIVPSPDWFVGVDSLDLCRGSVWRASHTVELHPYDAGTDMGYTFTAPNWPETPPKGVSQVTSQSPSHPANSFYYPDKENLPPIGRLDFRKVATYDVKQILEEENDDDVIVDDEDSGDVIDTPPTPAPTPAQRPGGRRWFMQRQRQLQLQRQRQQRLKQKQKQQGGQGQAPAGPSGATSDESAEAEGTADGGYVDCEVSEWSEWGACSKSCGFGKRMRMRSLRQRPQGAGRPCPPLMEDQLCGSMRNCGWSHFSRFKTYQNN